MGGLDEVTPPISRSDGDLRYGVNLEIGVRGGYATCAGYERYDGRKRPSTAYYAVLSVSLTLPVNVGDIVTNNAGTVSGTVIAVPSASFLVITKTDGLFTAGPIKVGATVVGTAAGVQAVGAAPTPQLNVAYTALAANVYRALIQKVPGSGRVLGVHQYKGSVYAFRNNAVGTAAVMFKDSPTGWTAVPTGRSVKFKQSLTRVRATPGTPISFEQVGSGFTDGQQLKFSNNIGGGPSIIVPGTTYFVINSDPTTFNIAATLGGAAINSTDGSISLYTATLKAVEFNDGDTVVGVTSGASGVAVRVILNGGTWDNSPSGIIVFSSITGTFLLDEGLSVNGTRRVSADGQEGPNTFRPNGRFEFENWNFGGQSGTLRMYGVDGVSTGFEFDGTTLVPIVSGVTPDAPKYMQIHKNALFYAFGSSVQYTGPGNPYAFSAIYGAGEITCGDDVTGMLSLPGSETSGAMAIKTKDRTFVLYGNSEDDFNLVPYSYEVGCEPHTMQLIAGMLSFDTQGISALSTTQRFGNFLSGIISDKITPFLNGKVGTARASCIVRKKNQYRIFFADGDAAFVTYAGEKLLGMTTINYPHKVSCISSLEGASGREEIYFGTDDGYVMQAESGTSFDGQAINWLGYLTYNHFKGPRQLKTYRKAAMEVSGVGYSEFSMSSSIGYGSTEFAQSGDQTLAAILTSSAWDSFQWDSFQWDGRSLLPSEGDLYGTAENMSLIFRGNSDAYEPITLNSAIIHYTNRRLLR